jgi:hypothetical protein
MRDTPKDLETQDPTPTRPSEMKYAHVPPHNRPPSRRSTCRRLVVACSLASAIVVDLHRSARSIALQISPNQPTRLRNGSLYEHKHQICLSQLVAHVRWFLALLSSAVLSNVIAVSLGGSSPSTSDTPLLRCLNSELRLSLYWPEV